MPYREEKFVNGGIYHVFNKTIDRIQIFDDVQLANNFLDVFVYYRSDKPKVRYSWYKQQPEELKEKIYTSLRRKSFFKVEILSYCLMPNHFHLLLKQKLKGGIIQFMSDVLNSFTRYYNIKNSRKGPLFLTQFKAKRIKTREQLIHVSRYIHLNPFSSSIVNSKKKLIIYPYSSFYEYLYPNKNIICDTEIIMNEFQNNRGGFRNFVLGNADYQKELEGIKYVHSWVE